MGMDGNGPAVDIALSAIVELMVEEGASGLELGAAFLAIDRQSSQRSLPARVHSTAITTLA